MRPQSFDTLNRASSSTRLTAHTSAFSRINEQPAANGYATRVSCPWRRTHRGWCAGCRRLWSRGVGLTFGRDTQDATTWRINTSGPGRVESDLSVKTKTHIWDDTGDSIVEHVAGVDDFELAEATYRAAVARWPTARITLRRARGSCTRAAGAIRNAKPRRCRGSGRVLMLGREAGWDGPSAIMFAR
jgi:hypothetical protein